MNYSNSQKKSTVASVESLTGGLFASKIVNLPGASSIFKGSLVAYDSQIKEKIGLDISKGVINAQTALGMAQWGQEFFEVDFCVAFTGNAGPQGAEGKPVGLVYIAINEQVWELNLTGTRNEIRKKCVDFAWNKIKDIFSSIL